MTFRIDFQSRQFPAHDDDGLEHLSRGDVQQHHLGPIEWPAIRHAPSWADFIIGTPVFKFSVHAVGGRRRS